MESLAFLIAESARLFKCFFVDCATSKACAFAKACSYAKACAYAIVCAYAKACASAKASATRGQRHAVNDMRSTTCGRLAVHTGRWRMSFGRELRV
jgi:hypothetical protein